MIRLLIIIISTYVFLPYCFTQNNLPIIVTFKTKFGLQPDIYTKELLPDSIQSLQSSYSIDSLVPLFGFAKSEYLKHTYKIIYSGVAEDVLQAFKNDYDDLIEGAFIDTISNDFPLYDPIDYFWQNNNDPQDGLWFLKKIEADKAWDITKGNPNLRVAVVDFGHPDIRHPDIAGKVDPPIDFYSDEDLTNFNAHPTSVISFLAGETTEVGDVSEGNLASIGFKTRVMYSSLKTGESSLARVVYASTVMKAKVISISWFSNCGVANGPNQTKLIDEAEKEILGNGTLIVRAAGNYDKNLRRNHCDGGFLYPFSGHENSEGILVVSSTIFDDSHEVDENIYGDINGNGFIEVFSHNHNTSVDLCAPGYRILGATTLEGAPTPGNPYVNAYGTSQTTPIVAGVAALMLAVDPCLTNIELEQLLKSTTDPIKDAHLFPGQVGTGRVNAYKAVKAARDYGKLNQPILFSDIITYWNNERYLKGSVNFESGATLVIRNNIKVGETEVVFDVVNGATLNLEEGSFVQCNNCNDSKITFDVYGTMNLSPDFFLELNSDTYINIYPSGTVNFNGEFCIDNVNNIKRISTGGEFYVNGEDYTWITANGTPNHIVYSSSISGTKFYAKNEITTTGSAQTQDGTIFHAGRKVVLSHGFSAGHDFEAKHGSYYTCFHGEDKSDCIPKKSNNQSSSLKNFTQPDDLSGKLFVSPNPTQKSFTLSLTQNKKYYLQLLDVTGKTVLDLGEMTSKSQEIDVNQLENGIYFLKLTNANEQLTERIVVAR